MLIHRVVCTVQELDSTGTGTWQHRVDDNATATEHKLEGYMPEHASPVMPCSSHSTRDFHVAGCRPVLSMLPPVLKPPCGEESRMQPLDVSFQQRRHCIHSYGVLPRKEWLATGVVALRGMR